MQSDDIYERYIQSNKKLFSLKDPSIKFMNYTRWMSATIDQGQFLLACLSPRRQINQSLLDKKFIESYRKLSKREKMIYFVNTVHDAEQMQKQQEIQPCQNDQEYGPSQFNVEIEIQKRKVHEKLYLDGFCLKGQEMTEINLKFYLMRKSKRTDGIYILESTRANIVPYKIKLLFNQKSRRRHYQQLLLIMRKAQKELVRNMNNNFVVKKNSLQGKTKVTQQTPGFPAQMHTQFPTQTHSHNDQRSNSRLATKVYMMKTPEKQQQPKMKVQQSQNSFNQKLFSFKDMVKENQTNQIEKQKDALQSLSEKNIANYQLEIGDVSQINMPKLNIQKRLQCVQAQEKFGQSLKKKNFILKNELILQQQALEFFSISQTLQVQANSNGQIILNDNYLSKKFAVEPQANCNMVTVKNTYANYFLKNEWMQNQKGDIILTDNLMIKNLDSVVSFGIKQLKENIFSGKNLVNISLPVYIFRKYSHLQEMVRSMRLAPYFLQKASCTQDHVERMKLVVCFSISHIVLYFETYKPFNPILGETFQGYISGCPIYGQQICHHPPISSVLLYGRGYKVHYSIQEKMHTGFNCFIAQHFGLYTVQFDDGSVIKFISPKIKLSGLVFGKREFSVIGDCFFFDRKNLLYSQLLFEDSHGMFSKNRWKYRDQIEGFIGKVNNAQTMGIFERTQHQNYYQKNSNPSFRIKKQNIEVLSTCKGRIAHFVQFDCKRYYDVNMDMPVQLIQERYPLHSHSNYRSDIYNRRANLIQKCQQEKERLEVLQRKDAKLRSMRKKSHQIH